MELFGILKETTNKTRKKKNKKGQFKRESGKVRPVEFENMEQMFFTALILP